MKTRLTILFLSIGFVVYGTTFQSVPTVSMPSLQTPQMSGELCLPQVQVSMPSKSTGNIIAPRNFKPSMPTVQGNNDLNLSQVQIELPYKRVSPASVTVIASPALQGMGSGNSYSATPLALQFSTRVIKTVGGGASATGISVSSASTKGSANGGVRRITTALSDRKWKLGLGGWFDQYYNFQPNNDGGIPQAPYLTSEDELPETTAVPITHTPYLLLCLLAIGYGLILRYRKN